MSDRYSSVQVPMIGQLLAIDLDIGLHYLQDFYSNIELLSNGVSLNDIFLESKKYSKSVSVYTNNKEVLKGEIDIVKEVPKNSIAVLNYSGAMRMDNGLSSIGVQSLVDSIYKVYETDGIKAVVLKLNTGGGEVLASSKLGKAISESPIMFYVHSSLIASGGVLAAINADKIFLNDGYSQAGSIGAYVSLSKELVDYVKDKMVTVYSDLSGDKNAGVREVIDKNTTDKILKHVNVLAKMFQDDVTSKRQLKGDIESTLKGGLFYAQDAIDRGLVDGVLGFNELINLISSKIIFK